MKSKEEIEQLAFKTYGDGFLKGSFIHGYTQCQEDMAKDLQSILNNSVYVDFISKKEILKYINSLNKQD